MLGYGELAWWRLASFARGAGLTIEWLVTAAEMLAASRLLHRDDPESLANTTSECTAAAWSETRHRALQAWIEMNRGEVAVPPFAQRIEDVRGPPGYFEHVRLAVLEATKAAASYRPEEQLEPVLALLEAAGRARHWDMPPTYLGALLADMVGEPTPRSAYCAYQGAAVAALMLGHREADVVLELPNRELAAFFSALSVGGRCNVTVVQGDPNSAPAYADLREAEVSVFVPPFTVPGVRDFEVAMQVSHRKTACAVLNGVLFRSSVADQAAKEQLIGHGLTTVVALPPGSMSTMSRIPGAILLIERPPTTREVLMVDGADAKRGKDLEALEDRQQVLSLVRRRDDYGASRVVPLDEIAANDFNLLPERYVLPAHIRALHHRLATELTAPLGDLVEIYRPQSSPKLGPLERDWGASDIFEVVVSDLTEVGTAPRPKKHLRVSSSDALRLRKAELAEGDILLVTKGSTGKVGLVGSIPSDETWIANQSFAVLRLRGSGPIRDPRVLFRYLSSRVGQELLQTIKVGSTIPSIQMADLRRIQVLVPTQAEQEEVIRGVDHIFELEAQIDRIRQQQADLQVSSWPEITR